MTSKPSSGRRGRIVRLPRDAVTPTAAAPEPFVAALRLRQAEVRSLTQQLPDVAGLARLLAERLVGAALTASDEALLHFAAQVLAEARGARRMTLCCAAEDADRLGRALASSALDLDVTVSAHEDLHRGSIRVETELGSLEASVESALEALTDVARSAR